MEDISLQSYKDTASGIHVNHFIDVRLVGFKRNGNGNVLLNEQRLFEYLDLLGQYTVVTMKMNCSADYPTHVIDGNHVQSLSVYDNLVYRVSHASEIVNQGIATILSLVSPFECHVIGST